MKRHITMIIMPVIILIIMFTVAMFAGCKSFDPVEVKGYPAECNIMFTMARLKVKQGGKDNAIVQSWSDKCRKALDKIHADKQENNCYKKLAKLMLSQNGIDRKDMLQYMRIYNKCSQ